MPRASRAGDVSTNARKRYYRAAERNLKKAEQASGATAERYRALARQNFEDALNTYDPANTQRYSKPIQALADEFGVDLATRREIAISGTNRDEDLRRRRERQQRTIQESMSVKESSLSDPDVRAEQEAHALIRNKDIARRIIGGTVDIWKDEATIIGEDGQEVVDKKRIFPALFKYFNVEKLSELIKKLENILGNTLWRLGDVGEEFYDVVKLVLNKFVIETEVV